MSGKKVQRLVDDYADALNAIGDRAVATTNAALRRSLEGLLKDLRRFYVPFLDPAQTSASGGRPMAYSIAETASRFQGLLEAANGFMDDREIKRLQEQYQRDFGEAMALGGDLGQELARTVNQAVSSGFGRPNTLAVWSASQITTAYIQGESIKFRSDVAKLVTEATSRGWGYRKVEKGIREALQGAKDPKGITKRLGLMQRAELIARSELGNAYVHAQKRAAQNMGLEYVRWVATMSERTCPLCASRHAHVYRLGEVVSPAHPRCVCSLTPVPTIAVEEQDPDLRRELLDEGYWEKSREDVVQELAKAKGWDEKRTRAEMSKALGMVTPSERYQQPGIERTAQPVD